MSLEFPYLQEVKTELEEPTDYAVSDASESEAREAHALLIEDEPLVKPHGFVVSNVGAKRRRHHFIGNCYRRPGEHYRDFTIYGDTVPTEQDFDKVCSTCFPRGVLTEELVEEKVEESGDSDSTSSTHSSDP